MIQARSEEWARALLQYAEDKLLGGAELEVIKVLAVADGRLSISEIANQTTTLLSAATVRRALDRLETLAVLRPDRPGRWRVTQPATWQDFKPSGRNPVSLDRRVGAFLRDIERRSVPAADKRQRG
jgi:hypothetical protein